MGESSWFRDYERLLLASSQEVMESARFQCLQNQLIRLRKVQRSHKDRICLVFFRKEVSRYSEEGWVEILRGKLKALHTKERPVNFRVWMWNGLPLKIEFSRSPRFLVGADVEVIYTPKPWKRRKELTDIVDRQEHGPDSETADAEDAELQRS